MQLARGVAWMGQTNAVGRWCARHQNAVAWQRRSLSTQRRHILHLPAESFDNVDKP